VEALNTLTSTIRVMYQATLSFHLSHPEDGDDNVHKNIGTASTHIT